MGPAFEARDKSDACSEVTYGEGIAHVLDAYARHIHPFKYIACSKREASILLSLWLFFNAAAKLFRYLMIDQEIKVVHFLDEIQQLGERKSIKQYLINGFLGKYLLCILIKIVFNKRFIYHINGDGISTYYAKQWRFGKGIIKRLFFLNDMVLCPSEEDLTFFKSEFNCKRVFIISEGIELLKDNTDHFIDEGLIKILYFEGALPENPNNRSEVKGDLKRDHNCMQKPLCDLLYLMVKNKERFHGKVKLLIAGIRTSTDYGGVGEKELECQLGVENENDSLIRKRAVCTRGLGNKQIYDLIYQRHLEGLVTYVDCSTPVLKDSLLKKANIVLMSEVNILGRTRYLEAMNYGLPIIATAKGNNCDMVLNGINGFLIPPEQRGAAFSAISHFINNPTDASLMGAASKELVKKFDIQNVLLKLKFIYLNFLN